MREVQHLLNLLINCIFRNEAVYMHFSGLSNSVRSINGLSDTSLVVGKARAASVGEVQ